MNPVYRREMTVRARSFRMPLILFVCNGLLALVLLLNMYQAVEQVKISGVIQYSRFTEMYAFAAALEFLLLLFIMPALTSGSISGERERQTLELLFTTKMTAADIVLGKLLSAFAQLMILVVSSFPVLLVTFVYGSVNVTDLGAMLACYVTAAFLAGSIGILCSSLLKRSTFSNVCTYGAVLAVTAGTLLLNLFCRNLSAMEIDNTILAAGETQRTADAGAAVWLLLFNPAMTFLEILGRQVVMEDAAVSLRRFLGARPETFLTAHWIPVSIAVQAAAAALMTAAAVHFLNPVKGRRTFGGRPSDADRGEAQITG